MADRCWRSTAPTAGSAARSKPRRLWSGSTTPTRGRRPASSTSTSWLIQKTTDLYSQPPTFTPMFTYERSVAYPHGHRNVMFAQRGVRTLPRLVGPTGVIDDDTRMLYDYLKEHNGICASHTSATG